MKKEGLERMSELTRISRERELTPEEQQERQALREKHLAALKANLRSQLDQVVIVDEHGNRRKLAKKPGK